MNQEVRWDDIPPQEEETEEAPLPAQFSEDNLARHWVLRHGKDWRYVMVWNAWFKWTGDHWQQEKTSEVFELARNITREALLWDGITKAERLRVNSARTASAMLQFIRADRKIAATVEQWDTNINLLGIPGGTIDLIKCLPIEPQREHYITKATSVAPAKGNPENWLRFLGTVTNEDQDIQNYLHRFAGYCLSGETVEHALAFLYGTGANGKTTFTQSLLGILGEYAITSPAETFTESRNERHPTEIARLRGARLVATEETTAGSRWNESRIKMLTGGNRMSARLMRQDDFEFQPEFKLLIAGNHKPQMRHVDEAMKRRIHIVPFTVTIPEEDRNPKMQDILREEWPQILNWMIEGCFAWRQSRLAAPEIIRNATETYLKNSDTLGAWLEDRCERTGNTDGKVLYNDFLKWCEEQGETVWSRRGWSDAMQSAQFETFRTMNSRGFRGVSLRHRPIENTQIYQ